MNDFTKEELEILRDFCISNITGNKPYMYLFDKIQSLINNYCEHGGVIEVDYPAEKCMKCGKMWK